MERPASSPSGAASSPRRVFTSPIPSAPQEPSGAGLVETLYNHPSVKIVSFAAGPRPAFAPGKGAVCEVEPGSLSWTSQLERTIAVGPFRIYRAPGSVAFLSCGSALQPILPKSQCWCVDEASTRFILQIRRPQYWRIEVPLANSEDTRRALLLRDVLDKVLRFEKTECPFKRAFTVDLPAPPPTPLKKRPWTPVRKTAPSLPPTPVTPAHPDPLSKRTPGRIQKPECFEAGQNGDKEEKPATAEPPRKTAGGFQASRAGTAPPQLALPPGGVGFQVEVSEPVSPADSHDSFHSVNSWSPPHTPLPPSPPPSSLGSPKVLPYAQDDIQLEKRRSRQWNPAALTIPTGDSNLLGARGAEDDEPRPHSAVSEPEKPPTATSPSLSSSAHSASGPPRRSVSGNHRPTTSSSISPSRRVLFPLPSAANLFSPRQPFRLGGYGGGFNNGGGVGNRLDLVRRLPMAVVHKTVEIFFSPPRHLINLMLRVAARIAAGEWRGYVFGTGESGETIPVRWDWSDEDDDGEGELGGWGADDDWPCAAPLGKTPPPRRASHPADTIKMAGSFPESPSDDDGGGEDDYIGGGSSEEDSARHLTTAAEPSGEKGEGEKILSDAEANNCTSSPGQSSEID